MVPIRTEEVPFCPLCQRSGNPLYLSLHDRLYDVPGDWNLYYCNFCEIGWLNPRPILDDIVYCYPEEYLTHEVADLKNYQFFFQDIGSLKKQIRVANLRNHFGYEHLPSQPRIISLLGKIAWIVPLLNDGMIKRLGARLPNYIPGGKILDIGCGNGSYLAPTLTSLQ